MKLIVGLGNPGEKYQNTRHNLGFLVVEALLRDLTPVDQTAWRLNKKTKCLVAKAGDLVLAKPQTMMNASGFAVAKLAKYYRVAIPDIWVIQDDLDLPLGKIKIKSGGGSAGHRGLESIVRELGGKDFVRFRLGIGRPHTGASKEKIEKFVLSPFRRREIKEVRKIVKKSTKAIALALTQGIEKASGLYN